MPVHSRRNCSITIINSEHWSNSRRHHGTLQLCVNISAIDGQVLVRQNISLHRGNAEEARKLIEKAVGVAVELLGRIEEEKKPGLRNGAMSSAMEELVEAMAFQHFLNHGTCIRKDDLLKEYGIQVTTDEYLGGVLDVRREGA